MTENYYIDATSTNIDIYATGWSGTYTYEPFEGTNISINLEENEKGKISPQLYFSYIKKKFKPMERIKLDRRIKKIEKAFDEAVENGQNVFAEKILNNLVIQIRESVIASKGIKEFIERDDLIKYKYKIKEGHISDTVLKDYTRVIPKQISDRTKQLKGIFDDFIIWHYWDDKAEEKREKKQKITSEEKGRMKDPILFGIIKETNKLYFIDDWIDEWCDLTFDDIVDVVGSQRIKKEVSIT